MPTLQQFIDACETQRTLQLPFPGEPPLTRNVSVICKRSQIFFLYADIQEMAAAPSTLSDHLISPYKLRVSVLDDDVEKSFPLLFATCIQNPIVVAFKIYSPPTTVRMPISQEIMMRYKDCSQWTIYLRVDCTRDIKEGNLSKKIPYFYPSDAATRQLVDDLQSIFKTQNTRAGRRPLFDMDCGSLDASRPFLGVTGRFDGLDPFRMYDDLYISQDALSKNHMLQAAVDELSRIWILGAVFGISVPTSAQNLDYIRRWCAQIFQNSAARAWYAQMQTKQN